MYFEKNAMFDLQPQALLTFIKFLVNLILSFAVLVAGKYLYTEASSPRSEHEFAVLESHSMPANREACLSMYYHMYGNGIGTLKVDVKVNTLQVLTNNLQL